MRAHGALHHPPLAVGGRAAVRRQPADVRRSSTCCPSADPAVLRAGRSPSPERVAADPPAARARPLVDVQYWRLHEEPRPALRPRLQLPEQRRRCASRSSTGCRRRSRWPSARVVVWLTAGVAVGIISAIAARHAARPHRDGRRAGRDLGAGLLARARRAVPVRQGHRRLPIFDGAGQLRAADRGPGRLVHVAAAAVVGAGRGVRRVLRAAAALEPARDDVARTTSARRGRRACASGAWSCATALRAAITPIVTVLGLDIGILLGGAILTETVFNIPGIGRLAYDAIQHGRPADDPGHGAVRRASSSSSRTSSSTSSTRSSTRACATRERAWPAARGPRPVGPLRTPRTASSAPSTASRYAVEPRPDAGHRRRVGLGQERLDADGDGPDPRAATRGSRARSCSTARTCRGLRRRAAPDPRQRHRDDLPGPAVLAAPVLPGRQPARRGGPHAPRRLQGRRRATARVEMLELVGIPDAAARASTATRTSSPAACASA